MRVLQVAFERKVWGWKGLGIEDKRSCFVTTLTDLLFIFYFVGGGGTENPLTSRETQVVLLSMGHADASMSGAQDV